MGKTGRLFELVSSALLGAIAGAMLAAMYGLLIGLLDQSVPYWTITTRLAPDLMIMGAWVVPLTTGKGQLLHHRLISSIFWALVGYYALSALNFYVEVIVLLTGGAGFSPSYSSAIGLMMGALYSFLTHSGHRD